MLRPLRPALLLTLFAIAVPAAAEPKPNPYAAIDRHALKAPKEAEESLEKLAAYLVKPASSDKDKARAVYRWVTDRIAYDADALLAGEQPDTAPDVVLKKRKALCGGYARLYAALGKQAGLEVEVVSGKAKGYGYNEADAATAPGHGWNAVKLGDDWQLVDTTWGAGVLKDKKFVKAFREFYFLAPPEGILFTHFPTKAKWQLRTETISEKEFDDQPKVPARFFEVGLTPSAIRKAMAADDFPGLVKVYDAPGSSLVLKEVPLAGTLKAGKKYTFRIETTDFHALIVSSGGRSTPLVRKGKALEATIVAPRGTIKVQGLVGEGNKITFHDLLEYKGE